MKHILVFAFACSVASAAVITSKVIASGVGGVEFKDGETPAGFTLLGDALSVNLSEFFATFPGLSLGDEVGEEGDFSGALWGHPRALLSVDGTTYDGFGWILPTTLWVSAPVFTHEADQLSITTPFTIQADFRMTLVESPYHEPQLAPYVFSFSASGTVTGNWVKERTTGDDPSLYYFRPTHADYTIESGTFTMSDMVENPEPTTTGMICLGILAMAWLRSRLPCTSSCR